MVALLSESEVERLMDDNECVAVDAVIAHYRKHGYDGHPAQRLYKMHRARQRSGRLTPRAS